MKKTDEQKLFELVESIGETLEGDLHIIDQTNTRASDDIEFRVYHKGGYCFDVYKKIEEDDSETGEVKKWYYDYYSEWDGFEKIKTANQAIELIRKCQKRKSK